MKNNGGKDTRLPGVEQQIPTIRAESVAIRKDQPGESVPTSIDGEVIAKGCAST